MEQRPAMVEEILKARPRDRASLVVPRVDRQPDARAGARGDGQGHRDHQAHDGAEARSATAPRRRSSALTPCGCSPSTGSATPRTTSTTTRRICTASTASSPTSSSSRSRGCWTTRRSSSTRSRCPGGTMQAPVGGVRGLAARVRRALPRGPVLLPRHAPADHRPPVAHHAAGGADPVHPRPPAGLARALRRGGGRAAARRCAPEARA